MNLEHEDFLRCLPKKEADTQWGGYLEAGKTFGTKRMFADGSFYQKHHLIGWELREREMTCAHGVEGDGCGHCELESITNAEAA